MPKLPVEPFYRVDVRSRTQFCALHSKAIEDVQFRVSAGYPQGRVICGGRCFVYTASADPDGNDADRNIVIVET